MPFRIAVVSLRLLILTAPTAVAVRAQAPAPAPITQLAWLGGCWEQRNGARVTEEQWMAPAGGTMVGVSRTVAREATRAWEFLRIVPVAGVLTYVAQPSGQAETSFPATAISDSLAVFENPAHDFPQRIEYRRVTADSIVARISATQAGKVRGMDIPMRRGRCGG